MADMLEIPIGKIKDLGERINIQSVVDSVCTLDANNILNFFLFPIIIILLLFLTIKYKEQLSNIYFKYFSKRGYIKILFRLPNRQMREKLKKLDQYNNFKIGKRKYSLEKLYHFTTGKGLGIWIPK
ncbi:unnamed protein product [marine sediment metagenome]|uniref:Uncharacterized protein n=1 Tax=marine sediment metagenome TaxID=412755 RepID=X1C8L9_9ZZZZ